ncbi:MAG: hypothetical protein JNL38_01035 [Myxococcales bacterium]|nr:hypothetical protein [Myxococcales bacterium]
MTPEQAVDRLAAVLMNDPELSASDIYDALARAGVPDDVADRAYKFTQIAWGRVFLGHLGLRFPPDYFCLNARGDIVESGQLDEEPYFVAATGLAAEHRRSRGFARFAAMSADVNAINDALHAGSKPENLSIAPPALFVEAPTPEGIAKARQEIGRRLRSR